MFIFTDQFIGLSICIRTAAKLIADDLGAWKGEEYSESDVSPFRRNCGEGVGLVPLTAHEYANLEPIGIMKIACQEIENAMVRSVEVNQIRPLQVSRQFTGELKPENTFLALTDVFEWCEIVGFEVGETLFEYLETEQNLRTNMISHTNKERFKLENRIDLDQSRESTVRLSEEEINNLVIENRRLREGNFGVKHTSKVQSLRSIEKKTLLTIIAVLCKEAKLDYTKHAKTAGHIKSTAVFMDIAIGESTIEGHLKDIRNALASRMK